MLIFQSFVCLSKGITRSSTHLQRHPCWTFLVALCWVMMMTCPALTEGAWIPIILANVGYMNMSISYHTFMLYPQFMDDPGMMILPMKKQHLFVFLVYISHIFRIDIWYYAHLCAVREDILYPYIDVWYLQNPSWMISPADLEVTIRQVNSWPRRTKGQVDGRPTLQGLANLYSTPIKDLYRKCLGEWSSFKPKKWWSTLNKT